jgi:hypothetical protein
MTELEHKAWNFTKKAADDLSRALGGAKFNADKYQNAAMDERLFIAQTKYNEFNPVRYYNDVLSGKIVPPKEHIPRLTDNKTYRKSLKVKREL